MIYFFVWFLILSLIAICVISYWDEKGIFDKIKDEIIKKKNYYPPIFGVYVLYDDYFSYYFAADNEDNLIKCAEDAGLGDNILEQYYIEEIPSRNWGKIQYIDENDQPTTVKTFMKKYKISISDIDSYKGYTTQLICTFQQIN
jgi:hypothetical protein